MEKPQKAYFQGKFFDSIEEMFEYAKKWPDEQVDMEQLKIYFAERIREAEMNLAMRGSLTNREAYGLIVMGVNWALERRKDETNII